MKLTIEEIIAFKKQYSGLMKEKQVKVKLTPYEARRHDAWANNIFGSSEYAFMWDILIHNEEDALENGYYIAGVVYG